MECLMELMLKRYMPTDPDSGSTGNGTGSSGLLVVLVGHACTLLSDYRQFLSGQELIDEAPVLLPLLEFLTAFCTVHLGRCLQNPQGQAAVMQLVQELIQFSCIGCTTETSLRATKVWQEILEVEADALPFGRVVPIGTVSQASVAMLQLCPLY